MKNKTRIVNEKIILIFGILAIIIGVLGLFLSSNITGKVIYDNPVSSPFQRVTITSADRQIDEVVSKDESLENPVIAADINSADSQIDTSSSDEHDSYSHIVAHITSADSQIDDNYLDDSREFVEFTAFISSADSQINEELTDWYDLEELEKYICGNNIIEPGEVCDRTELGTESCITQGFDGGTLSCSNDCRSFNTSSCLSISADGGAGGRGRTVCVPTWECGPWEECTPEGLQFRTCIDINGCHLTYNKPSEQQSCTYIVQEIPTEEIPEVIAPIPVQEKPLVGQAIGIARWNVLWLILVIMGIVAIVLYMILHHTHMKANLLIAAAKRRRPKIKKRKIRRKPRKPTIIKGRGPTIPKSP